MKEAIEIPKSGKYSIYPSDFNSQPVFFVEGEAGRNRGSYFFTTEGEAENYSRAEIERELSRKNAEEKEKEFKAAAEKESNDLDGFGEDLSPLALSRARKFLNDQWEYKGKWDKRKNIIKLRLVTGHKLENIRGHNVLVDSEGCYSPDKFLQGIGTEYAEYLIKSNIEELAGQPGNI